MKRHMLIAILVVVVFILTACPHTKKLSDASLAKISVGNTSLQNFNPDVNEYTVELAAGTVQVPVITVTPNVEGAVINIDNAKKLPGTTKITVTALNGRDRMFYYIHFTVQKSDDSSLSALFYNGIPVAEFEPERFDYEVVLPPEVLLPPVVSGVVNNSIASIEVLQAATLPGTATVIVTAEDGETTSTYSVLFVPSYRIGILCNPEAGGAAIGAGVFVHGDIVNLSISINEGYEFVDWSENGVQVSGDPDYSFEARGNRTLVANFTLKTYMLTVNVTGQGNVTRNPDKAEYSHGEIVQLIALPSEGWSFTGWSGDLSGSENPTNIVMNSDGEVTATFSLNQYTITVNANPEAGGVVTGGGTYNHGEMVNLTAVANSSYRFVNWTEDGVQVSNTPDYSFTARRNRTLVANFTRKMYTLTVNVTGNGTVAAVPASADNKYEEGTVVQLTPTPAAGWEFEKWVIGGVESFEETKTVTMNTDVTVEAVFEEEIPPVKYTLTVNVTGNGTVDIVPASADNKHEEGTVVQLTPTPADGWQFEKWVIGGFESTEVPKTVTMNADITVGAVFNKVPVASPEITNLSLTTEDFMVLQPCTTNLEIRFQVKVDDPDGDLTAAEYIVKHVTSGLFYKVAIPEDNWGAPWIYTISQTTLKNGIGNPIPGGEYEITVNATDANGSSASDSIAFFVKNSLSVLEEVELDIEGSQITIVDGYCLVSEGLPAKVEATISYDSKITARVYLVNTDFVGTLEEMLTHGDLIAEQVFTTESQTTETVVIELPDLMPLMDIGEEHNLVVLLFTPECGAFGCIGCGIEDWDVLDCDLVKNPDPYLECLPCECENPCDPCFKGYDPGLLIGNLLVTNQAEFDITLAINETVFTNEDFIFVEDPEDGTLEVRILLEEGMVTPELSGETDLYWKVVTSTDVELDAACTVVIDL